MKLDTTKIEGFDKMTAEQKLEAITNFDFAIDNSKYVEKTVFDSKASEAANYSKKVKELEDQLKAKLTPEEAKALAEKEVATRIAEKEKELTDELAKLKAEKAKAEYAKSLIAEHGMNDKEADEAAGFAQSNDVVKLLAAIKKSHERQEREGKERRVNNMGNLPAGNLDGKKPTQKTDAPKSEIERRQNILKRY